MLGVLVRRLNAQGAFVGEDGLRQFALFEISIAEVVVGLCRWLFGNHLFVLRCRFCIIAFCVLCIGLREEDIEEYK